MVTSDIQLLEAMYSKTLSLIFIINQIMNIDRYNRLYTIKEMGVTFNKQASVQFNTKCALKGTLAFSLCIDKSLFQYVIYIA